MSTENVSCHWRQESMIDRLCKTFTNEKETNERDEDFKKEIEKRVELKYDKIMKEKLKSFEEVKTKLHVRTEKLKEATVLLCEGLQMN